MVHGFSKCRSNAVEVQSSFSCVQTKDPSNIETRTARRNTNSCKSDRSATQRMRYDDVIPTSHEGHTALPYCLLVLLELPTNVNFAPLTVLYLLTEDGLERRKVWRMVW